MACITTTSCVDIINDGSDDVHDKFLFKLTVEKGLSIMLNILLDTQAVPWEKSICPAAASSHFFHCSFG
jgi:hypothetical protein